MEETQFEIGQYVVYGTNGICAVDRIELMSFAAGMPKEMYYVLRQNKNSETLFFVPLKNETLTSKMRAPMDKADIEDMLMGLSDDDVNWVDDRRERAEYFKSILNDGLNGKLLNMIICIYERKRKLEQMGKKIAVTDLSTLKTAEKLVAEEFSWVLGIEPDEVPKYIRRRLHIKEEE
ncbi:MAG: CarD family transcriptional regulator [Firmicutes bacterium]|mgnify:FL=1|nr:CarD family transcriptional regulator [Bacillota bacterium]